MKSKIIGLMINKKRYPKLEGWESIADVAKMLGKSPYAIHQRISRRKILPHRIGNQLIIKISDIQKLK